MRGRQFTQPSQDAEVHRIMDHLCRLPDHGTATATRAQLRAIMLQTGGTMLACGRSWRIKPTHLGAGVYRLSLERGS